MRENNDFEYPPLALWIFSAEELFIISRLSRSAERSKRIFTSGVVTGDRRCGGYPFRLLTAFAATFPKGTAKLPQSKPDGFANSLGEGASGAPANFAL